MKSSAKVLTIPAAILISILGSISTAHAFPDFTKLARSAPVKVDNKPRADVTCADFSGTWVGTCRDASGTTVDHTVVTQSGCDSIQSDSQDASPGGMQTTTLSRPGGSATVVQDAHWNSDYSDLQLNYFVYAKSVFQGLTHPAVMIPVTADVRLNDQQLVVSYQGLGDSGQCVYDKAQTR